MGMKDLFPIHRRYDGPIPAEARAAVRAGGWARLVFLRTEARRRVFDSLALDAVQALADRRRRIAVEGAPAREGLEGDPGLCALGRDLRFYREQGVRKN